MSLHVRAHVRGWSWAGIEHWPCLLRGAFRESPKGFVRVSLKPEVFSGMFWCVLSNNPKPKRRDHKHPSRHGISLETHSRKLAGCLQKAEEVIYFPNFTAGTKTLAGASVCDQWLIWVRSLLIISHFWVSFSEAAEYFGSPAFFGCNQFCVYLCVGTRVARNYKTVLISGRQTENGQTFYVKFN